MSIVLDKEKRITEIVYSLKCRNDRLGLSAPSYGDCKRVIKMALEEYQRDLERGVKPA